MKKINDNELDALINEAVRRQMMQENIEKNVMKELYRAKQKAAFATLLRLVGFSFGLPLLLLVCFWGLFQTAVACSFDKVAMVVIVAIAVLVVYSCNNILKYFSPKSM